MNACKLENPDMILRAGSCSLPEDVVVADAKNVSIDLSYTIFQSFLPPSSYAILLWRMRGGPE
jgi:hypothetical protein